MHHLLKPLMMRKWEQRAQWEGQWVESQWEEVVTE
jgi:hypothetical protein